MWYVVAQQEAQHTAARADDGSGFGVGDWGEGGQTHDIRFGERRDHGCNVTKELSAVARADECLGEVLEVVRTKGAPEFVAHARHVVLAAK